MWKASGYVVKWKGGERSIPKKETFWKIQCNGLAIVSCALCLMHVGRRLQGYKQYPRCYANNHVKLSPLLCNSISVTFCLYSNTECAPSVVTYLLHQARSTTKVWKKNLTMDFKVIKILKNIEGNSPLLLTQSERANAICWPLYILHMLHTWTL